jgi:hypothetical protein
VSGAVRCLLVLRPPLGAREPPPSVWSGGADGVVYSWPDTRGDMLVNGVAEGRASKVWTC